MRREDVVGYTALSQTLGVSLRDLMECAASSKAAVGGSAARLPDRAENKLARPKSGKKPVIQVAPLRIPSQSIEIIFCT